MLGINLSCDLDMHESSHYFISLNQSQLQVTEIVQSSIVDTSSHSTPSPRLERPHTEQNIHLLFILTWPIESGSLWLPRQVWAEESEARW